MKLAPGRECLPIVLLQLLDYSACFMICTRSVCHGLLIEGIVLYYRDVHINCCAINTNVLLKLKN